MAFVDVVIVNYNGGDYLRRAVEALEAQTWRDFRIVIVDNGSTDGSLEHLPESSIPLEVISAGGNLGFAGGNNLAIRGHLQGEWLALLNPDAFPRPDWLERLVAAARTHTDYSFFGCRMLDAADPARLDGVGDVVHVSGLHWRDGHGCPDTEAYRAPGEIFAPSAAAALYRTREVRELGGFDEDFFCYAEDVDLGFRLRLAGKRCMYVPDAVVEHLGSAITGRRSDFSVYYGHRNLVWAYVKNMPGILFWLYLPYHLLLNAVTLAMFSARGQFVVWRAKRDALACLPCFWRKRRAIQAARKATPAAIRAVMRGGLPRKVCRR